MLCDERHIFEDNDVEFLFEITNEHIGAVLRPNSLSRLWKRANKLCGFNWKHLSCLCAVLFGVLLGLIFLNLPSLLAINYIRSFSMRKQRNEFYVHCWDAPLAPNKDLSATWRKFASFEEDFCAYTDFSWKPYPQLLNKIITSRCCFKVVGNHISFQEEIAVKNEYHKFS